MLSHYRAGMGTEPLAPALLYCPPPMSRAVVALVAVLILVIALLSAAVWVLLDRGPEEAPAPPVEVAPPPEPAPDALVLQPAAFTDLPGWRDDRVAEVVPALLASCDAFARRPADAVVAARGAEGITAGEMALWREICAAARLLPAGDDAAARALFERRFRPWQVTNHGEPGGLFTGYYEPSLRGSRRRGGRFQTPLYAVPGDLVTVDLGAFREDLEGRRIAGKLAGKTLAPYADRSAIESGALAGRGLEILWVDDPVDAFFLQIQGSGRVELENGAVLRVGYASQNGHPYYAIGRELVERGELTREEVSMQSIRRWLDDHPDQAAEVMATNRSYVFFQELRGLGEAAGPLGSMGVPLTPERSLAVDATFLPLGVPLWLDGEAPLESAPEAPVAPATPEAPAVPTVDAPGAATADPDAPPPGRPLRRLVIAQDTGGAIRGPVRGDLFWGPGERAADLAGRMRHPGRLWILLPREIEPL